MTLAYHMLGLLTPILIIHAFAIPIANIFKSNKLPFILAIVASVFAVITSTLVFHDVYVNGIIIYKYGGWPPHFGIVYEVDLFNGLIGLFTAWVMLAIVIYSYWYRHHIDDPMYYALLVGLETGILGCLYTGDAFNLFVMLEVLGITAYGLVAYHRDRAEAVEAAAKYALIGAVATTLYFTAVLLLYTGFGTVNMGVLALLSRPGILGIPPGTVNESLKYIALISIALSLWVFTYKSALFPNHFWLPDAHPEAPTPVSAALSGLVVNVGVYAFARFLYTIFGEGSVLSIYRDAVLIAVFILGVVSGLIGALMMMIQQDIKRLLAYSTISHIGIIYMGISAGFMSGLDPVKIAMTGAVVHIIAHGVAKALLFMASGVFIDAAGSRNLDEMRGIGRHYPLASTAMILGFLNLAGFIPFIGFYSKWYIAQGYMEGGLPIVVVFIIIISAISLLGYLKVISAVVFSPATRAISKEMQSVHGKWVEYLLFTMALALLVLGVIASYVLGVFEESSQSLILGTQNYIMSTLRELPPELQGAILSLYRALMGVKP